MMTHREVVIGTRGGVHIAHPLADRALCGATIAERPGIDAFGRGTPQANGFIACHECQSRTYSGGGEARQAGAYA